MHTSAHQADDRSLRIVHLAPLIEPLQHHVVHPLEHIIRAHPESLVCGLLDCALVCRLLKGFIAGLYKRRSRLRSWSTRAASDGAPAGGAWLPSFDAGG
jgi:hypothetical protein